ncbi:MAG: hypothetical protein ABIZ80_00415 [Bryobacteraceae bacterium]
MNADTIVLPQLFTPHEHLSDAINHNIIQLEIEGGVCLEKLPKDAVLEVKTQNRSYTIENLGGGEAMISGHPKYCPEPVQVRISGSTWGGSMLKTLFIGRGMHLEFRHPEYRVITTSRILEIRMAGQAA